MLQLHNTYQHEGGEDTVVENEFQLLTEGGVEVEQLLFTNEGLSPTRLVNNNESAARVASALEDYQPDVLHVHNLFYSATPSVLYEAKKRKIPVVMTLHNYRLACPSALFLRNGSVCTQCITKRFAWPAVKHKCFKDSHIKSGLLSYALFHHLNKDTWNKTVDTFITLTPFAKEIFKKAAVSIASEKLVVKPNSTSSGTLEVISAKKRTGYLYVGRLSKEKGIETLIKAFNELPELQLEIVGSGELEPDLRNIASPNIRFLGKIPFAKVAEKLRTVKALLFTSIIYEGLPNTIIEAFAAGTPVIASNIDNINTIVTNNVNGVLFETGISEALKKTIQSFEETRKSDWYHNARATYEATYTHDQNFKNLMTIYSEAIERR